MSLVNLLGNKSRTLVLAAALTACGGDEVHNNYYVGNEGGSNGSNKSYTCDDIYERYVLECKANGNDEWKGTYECEKGNWPKKSPEWTQCIFEVPCEKINDVCDQLFDQSGI